MSIGLLVLINIGVFSLVGIATFLTVDYISKRRKNNRRKLIRSMLGKRFKTLNEIASQSYLLHSIIPYTILEDDVRLESKGGSKIVEAKIFLRDYVEHQEPSEETK